MKNILFCGNEYVFDGILTCALSIFKRSESKEPITFYVYTMDVSYLKPNYTPISDGLISFLDSVVKSYNPENKVIKIDVTDGYLTIPCSANKENRTPISMNFSYSSEGIFRTFHIAEK